MTNQPKPSAFDADETEALRAIGWSHPAGASSCPDSALLVAAEEGVLDQAVTARVREHVAKCATCQQLAKDLAVVLAEEPGEDVSSRIRGWVAARAVPARRSHPYIWAGAGALALAAGLIWFIFLPRPAPLPAPETQVARVTPPPVPTVFVVDRPAIPPGDVDLAVRGESTTKLSLEDQISAALDKADKGDLAGATTDLQGIAGKNKASRAAALALGAVQLRASQNAEAVATLESARSLKGDTETADEAGWFLSIALVRTGNVDRARVLLDDVCKHGGTRGPSACAGVAEIDRSKTGK